MRRNPKYDEPRLTIEDHGPDARDGRFVIRIRDVPWCSANRDRLERLLDALLAERRPDAHRS
jgi:hypothetical protein